MHLYIIVHKVEQFIYLSFILFWKVYVCTKSNDAIRYSIIWHLYNIRFQITLLES